MGFLQAVVLGVVQGFTEFLPISSDGHLALAYRLFGSTPDLTYEVFLHGATLIAMYAYFRTDVVRLVTSLLPRNRERSAGDRRLVGLIVIATLVSGVVGLAIEPVVEPMAASMFWVGVWFIGTAVLLTLGEALSSRTPRVATTEALSWPRAAFVAVMQGLAVLPGLSRSGSTIAGGMLAGLSRENAARFSFLAGMPLITAVAAKDAIGVIGGTSHLPAWPVAAAGFAASGICGYLAIWGLLRLVKSTRLYGFAVYTAILGAVLIIFGARVGG